MDLLYELVLILSWNMTEDSMGEWSDVKKDREMLFYCVSDVCCDYVFISRRLHHCKQETCHSLNDSRFASPAQITTRATGQLSLMDRDIKSRVGLSVHVLL